MMMTLKGLPLAYNKDMQEDKEGLFDALDTWLDCLHMAALVLDGIQVKRPRCAEAAQQLVEHGGAPHVRAGQIFLRTEAQIGEGLGFGRRASFRC